MADVETESAQQQVAPADEYQEEQEQRNERSAEQQQDLAKRAEFIVEDAIRFIFNEYDLDHDGLMSRKEFFTFLWELKLDPAHKLNEGQMMSCWKTVDKDTKGQVTVEEFTAGLEICYDNHFFALENGAKIHEAAHVRGILADNSNYNTIKFKKSLGVALFNEILEEEKRYKSERGPILPPERQLSRPNLTMASSSAPAPAPAPAAAPVARAPVAPKEFSSSMSSAAAVERRSKQRDHVATPEEVANAAAAANGGQQQLYSAGMDSRTIYAARPGMNNAMKATDKEAKRQEAQRNVDKILAEKYQEQRRTREAERIKKAEEERRKSAQEAENFLAEPAWKRQIKGAPKTAGYKR